MYVQTRADTIGSEGGPLVLRPYQVEVLDVVRAAFGAGCHAVLMRLPTGAGKTVVFAEVARGAAAKGNGVLILVHRRELVKQAVVKLAQTGIVAGVIAPGWPFTPERKVQVASIKTLTRCAIRVPDLVVIDEAHHARASEWRKALARWPRARVLGVTATPERSDGLGLGVRANGPFDRLVSGTGEAELIRQGWIVPTRCFTVDDVKIDLSDVGTASGDYEVGALGRAVMAAPHLLERVIEEYRLHAAGLPAVAFCCTVAHAETTARAFRAAGFRAAALRGGMKAEMRDRAIAGLAGGSIDVLTSCALIDEGLDVPGIRAVILLRPTKSLVLHRQQIGRGMRPDAGKNALVVLDFVNRSRELGLPEDEILWSLEGRRARVARGGRQEQRQCECCGCLITNSARLCVACEVERGGAEDASAEDEGAGVGALVELGAAERERLAARRLEWRRRMTEYADTLDPRKFDRAALEAFRIKRNYRPSWVEHRLAEQQKALEQEPQHDGIGPD